MANPKQLQADTRVPLHLCPPILTIRVAAVMRAALKEPGRYPYNYRYNPSSLKTYIDAAKRHLLALEDGQWDDPKTGEPHTAHVACNMGIIEDCKLNGTLVMDLPVGTGKIAEVLAQYNDKYKSELEQAHPGVVRLEDGKDCGDPDCKAAECLQTRVERMLASGNQPTEMERLHQEVERLQEQVSMLEDLLEQEKNQSRVYTGQSEF